MFVVIIKVFIL